MGISSRIALPPLKKAALPKVMPPGLGNNYRCSGQWWGWREARLSCLKNTHLWRVISAQSSLREPLLLTIYFSLCPTCHQEIPSLSRQYSTILLGEQPATWWQVDHTGRGGDSFWVEWIHIWGISLPFLPSGLSRCCHFIWGQAECLIHQHGILCDIFMGPRTHFTTQ